MSGKCSPSTCKAAVLNHLPGHSVFPPYPAPCPRTAVQAASLLTSPSSRILSAVTEKNAGPKLLLDGKAATCMQTKSSTDELGAWVTVDLGAARDVRTVVLTNRWAQQSEWSRPCAAPCSAFCRKGLLRDTTFCALVLCRPLGHALFGGLKDLEVRAWRATPDFQAPDKLVLEQQKPGSMRHALRCHRPLDRQQCTRPFHWFSDSCNICLFTTQEHAVRCQA